MSKFDEAFYYVIKNEGNELSTDPTDRGGVSKFGISSKFLSLICTSNLVIPQYSVNKNIEWFESRIMIVKEIISYVKNLDIHLAKLIYEEYFWKTIYEKINDQDIINYIFDMHVQHGEHKAIELTQRAINACLQKRCLKIDGIIGKITLNYFNSSCMDLNYHYFKSCLKAVRESLFRCIVAHDKTQENKLEGWLRRCYR